MLRGRFKSLLGKPPGFIKDTNIPKFIHQTWKTSDLNDPSNPEIVIKSVKAWKEKFPGYTYLLWNDTDMEDLVYDHYPHFLEQYKKLIPIMRTDLFRLLVLHKYGGIVIIFSLIV